MMGRRRSTPERAASPDPENRFVFRRPCVIVAPTILPAGRRKGVTIALLFIVNIALIAAIIGVVHWVGGSATARLDSAKTARAAFLAEFPDANITEITLTRS